MISAGCDWLHVDIMDGHFVPNLTIGPPVLSSLRKSCPDVFFDCHLMVSDPSKWVDECASAGANSFTFHIEAEHLHDPLGLVHHIKRAGMKAAVAIKPETPVEALWDVSGEVDMVLVMTVEPGFGGQAFNPHQSPKIRALRQRLPPTTSIQVDGGITVDTCESCVRAGANVLVAGSAIFNAQDPALYIQKLRERAQRAREDSLPHS